MVEQNLDIKDFGPSELKDKWSELDASGRKEMFDALPRLEKEDLFLSLSAYEKVELIGDYPLNERRSWVRLLPLDDLTDFIQALPEDQKRSTLMLLDEQIRKEVLGLLAYAEDHAGGLMNPRYFRLRAEMSVDEAIKYLRAQAKISVETIYYAYVLDLEQKLIGVISFRELLLAPSAKTVQEIMSTEFLSVHEETDQEEISRLFAQNDLMAIPVVDQLGKMKGIVTYDDIVDVVEQEATEDIQKLGGMEALDGPYFMVSTFDMIKKRAGWLVILFLGEMFTATAMGHYEHEISKAVVLALFIPLIISSGGNSGSQASTLIIRSLALREIRLRDWWRVLIRELGSGLTLGVILGVIGFFRIVLWQQWYPIYGEHYILVALVVSFSLVGIVLWGTLSGSMLPFVLRRLGLDPASASAPFVATLVDVTGLIIYFTVASFMLQGTLL